MTPDLTTGEGGTLFETEPAMTKTARISDCGTYRYWLGRRWGLGDGLTFVMLNPSTADAELDDPTIRRCIGFAKREGFGAINVLNLYAYRSPSPAALKAAGYPVGPHNDTYIGMNLGEQARRGHPVIAAWGAHAKPFRVVEVMGFVTVDWRCLGTTKDGAPRHPLYVKGDQPLIPFETTR